MISAYGGVLVRGKAFARPFVGREVAIVLEAAHGLCRRAELSRTQSVERSEMPSGSSGLGSFLEHAMVSRRAASARFVLFAVRRASEVAGLKVSDVRVVGFRGVV